MGLLQHFPLNRVNEPSDSRQEGVGGVAFWDYRGDAQMHRVAESAFQLWNNPGRSWSKKGNVLIWLSPPQLLPWIIVFLAPGCIWHSFAGNNKVLAKAGTTNWSQEAASPHQRSLQFPKCSQATQAQAGAEKGVPAISPSSAPVLVWLQAELRLRKDLNN